MSTTNIILEAIASTALSHPAACDCDACKANGGDKAALVRILAAVSDAR